MGWTYHNDPAFRVTTARFFALIGYAATEAELYRFRSEARRHMRATSVYSDLAGINDPERLRDGRYRIAYVGRPYRAWYFREFLGQLRAIGLTGVSVVLADTHRESEWALIWDALGPVLDESLATPAAQVGRAVLDTTAGAADVVGSVGQGLREGLPAAGEGVGDLIVGVGDAASSLGSGARTLGAASTIAPTLTTILVLAAAAVGFAMYTGALKFQVG